MRYFLIQENILKVFSKDEYEGIKKGKYGLSGGAKQGINKVNGKTETIFLIDNLEALTSFINRGIVMEKEVVNNYITQNWIGYS